MFILLHTNDFHNHLTTRQADTLRHMRQALGTNGMLMDAGDAVASGNVTFRPWGETILKTMSEIGYDAMTVGNREFHVSRAGFHCKVGLAQFPVLCANVRSSKLSSKLLSRSAENQEMFLNAAPSDDVLEQTNKADNKLLPSGAGNSATGNRLLADPPVCSYMVRTLQADDGTTLRLVIFGLTVPMVTERMSARHVSAYLFDNPIVTAQCLVPKLQQEYQPDVMIALSHIGNTQDRKLAEAVPGIDLIIGGHSHTRLETGERVGDTLIAQTGCFGHHVGRIDILPRNGNCRPELRAFLLPLPKAPTEAEVEAHVQQLRQDLAQNPEATV